MPVTIHKQFQLKGHTGSVYALVRYNNSFFSAGSEGIIAQWTLQGDADANALARVNGQVFTLYHSVEDNRLLAGTMDGILYVIDIETRKETRAIQTETASIFDITFIPRKNIYAVASKMGVLNFYD